jgi:hypothetical protein
MFSSQIFIAYDHILKLLLIFLFKNRIIFISSLFPYIINCYLQHRQQQHYHRSFMIYSFIKYSSGLFVLDKTATYPEELTSIRSSSARPSGLLRFKLRHEHPLQFSPFRGDQLIAVLLLTQCTSMTCVYRVSADCGLRKSDRYFHVK